MLFSFVTRLRTLRSWFRMRFGLVFGRRGLRRGLGRVDKLRDSGSDGLVCRQLGLGVEVEVALRPVKGVDDGLIT